MEDKIIKAKGEERMSNEELQKKIDEYCGSQESCKECIFT